MKRKGWITLFVLVFLAAAVGGGTYYAHRQASYIITDNARVEAETVTITPEATGRLSQWKVKTGDRVKANDVLGVQKNSRMQTTGQQPGEQEELSSRQIRSPIDGVVIRSRAVSGQAAVSGMPLAMVADLSHPYIQAYIDEDQIREVHKDQSVDVSLDAYPDTAFSGTVSRIGTVAGNPSGDSSLRSSGSSAAEVQRVPVRVRLDGWEGKRAIPGMNATVSIHR
ncbi:HlyD family secretion protein [Paludifilum halophilum]|uniref:RND efflux pump membrane fusion protein barrel-sandwich domain-containing protein n=1 Tax=Paludifilum halophilum TaxID=1642702 RepID=A0A235B4I5_9BACL|nr:efflux RND transporter periplasmic adaptor subunit [Paludifilum halophilum]OYD06817.1 hypothetical protein CHM34_14800 [Paludifilum halophilum]